MTHQVGRSSPRRVPRIWLLPAFILALILGLTANDFFSRSLLLDLVAWWPVWFMLAVLGVLSGRRRIGRVRASGLVSLVVAAVLVVFVVGHVSGWTLNPSTSRNLTGPPADSFTEAELVAVLDGELHLEGGAEFLYEVDPLPGGGEIGIPAALERRSSGAVSVSLEAPEAPGFDRSSGWDISLSAVPRWDITLGGEVDVDLSELEVAGLDVSGSGRIVLGSVDELTEVYLNGAFTIRVPADIPARVVGEARVPVWWEETSDGWSSPVEGDGWVITVPAGSVISIAER